VGDTDNLLIERDGPIVTLTMNRPEAKNALSAEMLGRMADAWEMINDDVEIRVAILTGAGGTFCAGADLKAMTGTFDDEWGKRLQLDPMLAWKGLLRNSRVTKPLIAAVEGYCVAGGTEILQSTDIRIAGEGAQFGVTEVTRGLFPMGGSTVRLRRQIPYTKAMEMLLTGQRYTAQEALSFGLIGRIVADGQTLDEARKVAEQIAANGPLAVQAVKKSVQETEGLPEPDALNVEFNIGWPIFQTEDAKEGPRAFAEKRPPNFRGR
jgi:enoyl-CoA hydratase